MIPKIRHKEMAEVGFLILVYGVCIALAGALWAHPTALAGCYVLVGILTLLRWHTKADAVSYAVAAVLGPLGESVAVHFGAWSYTDSTLLVPMWLPLLWGIAGLFLRRLSRLLSNLEPRRE